MPRPNEELVDLLTPELREKVEAGEYRIQGEGQNPAKPVVIDAATGRIVKGSGRPQNANDIAAVSKQTAFKRSKSYNEALEVMAPAYRDTPGAIISLEELIEQAKKLIVPEKRKHKKDCPQCHTEVVFEVDRLPDAKTLIFMIERLAGAAAKTTEVNVHSEEYVRILHDKRVVQQVEIVALTAEQRAANARAVLEA